MAKFKIAGELYKRQQDGLLFKANIIKKDMRINLLESACDSGS
jgi:hypothetical protein